MRFNRKLRGSLERHRAMKREEPEHVLRAASHIVKQRDFLVIGSAAIPGTCSEDVLPRAASRSEEADLIRRLAARQRPVRWSWACGCIRSS